MADETPIAKTARTADEILVAARTALEDAQQGLADMTGLPPARRLTGLRNVAVFGRSVTWVLQNLRSVDKGRFNRWYAPFVEEMREDPLMRYFVELRNRIEKEGAPPVGTTALIHHLDTRDLAPLMTHPPPGAHSFFIGDATGGSGWEIGQPGGRMEKFYVALPESISMTFSFSLPDPPTEHLGTRWENPTAEEMCAKYLHYLASLLDAAEEEFST